jgi:hypothetical protein
MTQRLQKTSIRSYLLSGALFLGALSVMAVAANAMANPEEQAAPPTSAPPAPTSTTTTIPATTTTSTTTTTMPDLSGIDFVELARSQYGKCGEWRDLAISVGWPESEWPTLSEIIWRESRCEAGAWNGWDAGLTQINQIHREWLSQMGFSHPEDMFNPENNLYFAWRLWDTSGWKPWRFSGTIPSN